jgi:hypothetical protein
VSLQKTADDNHYHLRLQYLAVVVGLYLVEYQTNNEIFSIGWDGCKEF